ncbi:ABC-type Zn2+ transport system substrate-binding protein/surface adhesin [Dysgonomonadaceae bacterium PH5-43]|nr:ABC-type Zn2+ transport system substrate-binding protein/surface adhesin [Dysgonomonadaceae bacterium PH5-43]
MKKILFTLAVCGLTLFACNKTKSTEHIHGEDCNHEHVDSHEHKHDANCNHDHHHDTPAQESFTVEE